MKVTIGPYDEVGDDRPTEIEFDSQDFWSLDSTLSRIIAPALRGFKENSMGWPSYLGEEEWNTILDKMIFSFEWCSSKARWTAENEPTERIEEGLKLFAEHFNHLWT